jgi:hypothetical protein
VENKNVSQYNGNQALEDRSRINIYVQGGSLQIVGDDKSTHFE